MRDLGGASLVITDRSSGIGRAAAMAFARQGACVTLAVRRETVLREAAAALKREAGKALCAPTDVGEPEAVWQLAQRQGIKGGWRSPAKRAMVTAGLAIAAGLAALVLASRAARGGRRLKKFRYAGAVSGEGMIGAACNRADESSSSSLASCAQNSRISRPWTRFSSRRRV